MKKTLILCAIFFGGVSALIWQIIWQSWTAIFLGASAKAAALILAAVMGGMTVGSLLSRRIPSTRVNNPLTSYAFLEFTIGVSGLLTAKGFEFLSRFDSQFGNSLGTLSDFAQAILLAVNVAVPTMAMGMTIPLFPRLALVLNTSTSRLYALNTFGAALSALLVTFFLVPALGLLNTTHIAATLNILAALFLFLLRRQYTPPEGEAENRGARRQRALDSCARPALLAFSTGAAMFGYEVLWFRILRAAFFSTCQTYSIILFSVLLPLAVAGTLASRIRTWSIAAIVVASATLCLFSSLVIEVSDLVFFGLESSPWFSGGFLRFLWSLLVLAPAVLSLGMALPKLFDLASGQREIGRLCAWNGLGSVLGSLFTAWIFLPFFGLTKTAFALSCLLFVMGALGLEGKVLARGGAAYLAMTLIYLFGNSQVGSQRVVGASSYGDYHVIDYSEGPESTISALNFNTLAGTKLTEPWPALFIDGFAAAAQWRESSSYMAWMGRLPMLLHPNPQETLVICFGTGQTANAVRQHNPQHLRIVDLNETVFQFGKYFSANQGVLNDPRVTPTVSDGRGFLRRSHEKFDVITQEPMPPSFAGVNSLYSQEYYISAYEHLNPGGIMVQWLPAHLVTDAHSRSIAKTFRTVFPDSFLWSDSSYGQGILVGRKGPSEEDLLVKVGERSPHAKAILEGVVLSKSGLEVYSKDGQLITDDNQLLSYDHPLDLKISMRAPEIVLGEFAESERRSRE